MYCLYPKKQRDPDELPGPLFMKIMDGCVIVAFATRALAGRFAKGIGVTGLYRVVAVDELGTEASPFPDSWMNTKRAIFFGCDRTIELYMRSRDSFAYDKYLIWMNGPVFDNEEAPKDVV